MVLQDIQTYRKSFSVDPMLMKGGPAPTGFREMYAAYQCIHDNCPAELGHYIKKGNSDTGPVEYHLPGVSRVVLPPSIVNTADQLASNYQGRCNQCLTNEASTEP